jgi:hypothetical protein
MAATVALELIGHRHQPLAAGVRLGERLDLLRDIVDALIEVAPVADQVLDRVQQARGKGIGASGQDARQLCPQAVETLGDGDAAVEQEGADLVGDRRALADVARAPPGQRLQIELLGGLGGNEAHGSAAGRLRRSPPHRGSRSCCP